MRAPALRPGDSAGCARGSGSNLYTGSRHQERTDLRADAALHYTPFHPAPVRLRPMGNLYLIAGLDDPEEAARWGRLALEAASRAARRGSAKRRDRKSVV